MKTFCVSFFFMLAVFSALMQAWLIMLMCLWLTWYFDKETL